MPSPSAITCKKIDQAMEPARASLTCEPKGPNPIEYDACTACIIYWEDSGFDQTSLLQKICAIDKFFRQHLAANYISWIRIPVGMSSKDAEAHVQWYLEGFKSFSLRRGDKVLQIVYYSGHGSYPGYSKSDPDILQAVSGTHQFFSWKSLDFGGKSDTVLFLDCCHTGQVLDSSLKGCKEVFGACSATDIALAWGPQSFTHLFCRAFLTLNTEDFSLAEWARATLFLAQEAGSVLPVHKAIGDGKNQIRFQPQAWLARTHLLNSVEDIAQKIFVFHDFKVDLEWMEYDAFPDRREFDKIFDEFEYSHLLEEPFWRIEAYRMLKKIADRKAKKDVYLNRLRIIGKDQTVCADKSIKDNRV